MNRYVVFKEIITKDRLVRKSLDLTQEEMNLITNALVRTLDTPAGTNQDQELFEKLERFIKND